MRPFRFVPLLACLILVAPSPSAGAAVFDSADRDTTCAPCRDFDQYANGGWIARTTLPPSYSTLGSFTLLADRNQETVRALLEDAVAQVSGKAPTTTTDKLGVFYGTCMDSARAEREGARPIASELDRIDFVRNVRGLAGEIGRMHDRFVQVRGGRASALFGFGANQDAKRSERMIAVASQGGITLPDRDYYTKTDSVSRVLRERYAAHVQRMFRLLGDDEKKARAAADHVLAIETRLAGASMTNVQRRDPNAVYHLMSLAELKALAPAFDWDRYLKTRGVPAIDSLNVNQPEFFKALGTMLNDVPLADWKDYLRWNVVSDAAPLLSTKFVNESFEFAKLLTGAKELQPRWKRCLQATDQVFGQALGEAYVARAFTPESKARALAMVRNMEGVLHDRISGLDWMGDATRARAIAKLEAFGNKIGYPDKWRDYSKLVIASGPFTPVSPAGFPVDPLHPGGVSAPAAINGMSGTFVENRWRVAEFESDHRLKKIGRPFDRTDWRFTVPTVNASYSPNGNEITFPAGILQPPFFDPAADDAVNYGGIGTVIGHEMTHGFDDSGRQFDAAGNLEDWWTAEDDARFKERAGKVVEQFDGYVAVDDVHVNGKLTLGENLADLGGVAIAYAALERSLEGKPRPSIDGFTPEQRFFLSYARIWRQKSRPEATRTRVATDPHSPGHFRVIGPLSNLPEFEKAWGCKAGDPMVRAEGQRARIW